jgi:hypothetical protein
MSTALFAYAPSNVTQAPALVSVPGEAGSSLRGVVLDFSLTPSGQIRFRAMLRMRAAEQSLLSPHSPYHGAIQVPGLQRQEALIQLLQSWLTADEPENSEEWEDIKRGLDAHRPSSRKLFP